jgi:transcriptional regulator with XRE-family HTH domain
MVGTHPLTDYRKAHGLTRKALADALGVTEVTVGRWENGKRGVSKTFLPVIEQTCGIGAADILRFEREGI